LNSRTKRLSPKKSYVLPKSSSNSPVEGFPQSYIDFFYITSGTIPEVIEPSEQYREEFEKNKIRKKAYGDNNKQEELINLKETLITAEGDLP
jgi:hypothetical protein